MAPGHRQRPTPPRGTRDGRATRHTVEAEQAARGGWARWTVWAAGLVVALGAGVATAHGLYEVALAAGTPRGWRGCTR